MGHTAGKLEVSCGAVFEAEPKDADGYPERCVAQMFRSTHPKTGAFLRPPTEADANAHHFVACWNACEGLDPEAIPGLIRAARDMIVSILSLPPCRDKVLAYVDPEEVTKLAEALNVVTKNRFGKPARFSFPR